MRTFCRNGNVTILGLLTVLLSCLPQPLQTEDLHDSRLVTMRLREDIPSVSDPEFVRGDQADRLMRPSEKILGLLSGNTPVAISVALLDRHEIVNDDAGEPFVASW